MKRMLLGFSFLLAVVLTACGGTPTPSGPTPTPLAELGDEPAPTVTESITVTAAPTTDALTTPTTPEPEAQPPAIVVYQAGDPASIVVVDSATGQIAPFLNPSPVIMGGANSVDALQGKIYAIVGQASEADPFTLAEISPAGAQTLIDNEVLLSTIAAYRTDYTLLAYSSTDGANNRLNYFSPDALGGAMVAEQPTSEGDVLPLRWSSDAANLYYTVQPPFAASYGVLLGGFSSLYRIDIASRETTTLIPFDALPRELCLDDLSPDETMVANHCVDTGIGILSVGDGSEVVVIQPPAEVNDWTMAGSTKFSPDSTRIAFAVVRGDPNNEQGWVLVTDDLGGASRLIATAAAGDYLTVEAWLDNNSVILQSHGEMPAVWLVRLDGSEPVKLADGTFLDLMR